MAEVLSEEKVVTLPQLRQSVRDTKSQASQRQYMAMLNRLEEYVSCELIPLDRFDKSFVNGFVDHLNKNGLTGSSVRQMVKFFRGMFRPLVGKEMSDAFKLAFSDVDTTTEPRTNLVDIEDLRRIVSANIPEGSFFDKVRDVFMLSFYDGGTDLGSLTARLNDLQENGLPQQRLILENDDVVSFLSCLSAEQYAKALDGLGYKIGLRHPLKPESAGDAYKIVSEAYTRSAAANDDVRQKIADNIYSTTPGWYAMRCYDKSPLEAASQIKDSGILSENKHFNTFIAPEHRRCGDGVSGDRLLQKILFFNCTRDVAERIKDVMGEGYYVYSRTATRIPASIPRKEMLDFMLLCQVAESEISFYFPEYALPKPESYIGRKARIVCGELSGQVCEVTKEGNDRFRVFISMPFFGNNMRLTGNVPFEFLQFID